MNCSKHYDRVAINRCNECGEYMCDECSVSINSVPYCKDCVAKMAAHSSESGARHAQRMSHQSGRGPAPRTVKRGGGMNSFFLFCLSCVPGLNYMYLGLMKRGMFFMTLFFMITFVAVSLDAPMFMMLLFIEFCYSFFDGFRLLGFMRDGYAVDDNVNDIMEIYTSQKRPIIVFSVVAVALSLMHRLGRVLTRGMGVIFGGNYGYITDLFSLVFGVIIIVLGCFIVAKGMKKKNGDDKQ